MAAESSKRSEIIAFASGKGGTGKTLTAVCFAYALVRAGHAVLTIDADAGTDGLSLFLLGPKGSRQISSFGDHSTFVGALRAFRSTQSMLVEPRRINRIGSQDHGVTYEAIISTNRIYGDAGSDEPVVPDLDRAFFRKAIAALFDEVRKLSYDYILVDTRGGFAFESTDVCAYADSFIVVTEPDFTSFYQDRNLLKHINAAAATLSRKPLLRSIIVNKATDGRKAGTPIDLAGLEQSFRLELTKEFPIRYEDTHAVPIDIEAVEAYKKQLLPYLVAPASAFSFATLSAFGDILQVVTAPWPAERVTRWNELVENVSNAVGQRNSELQENARREATALEELNELRRKNVDLDRHVAQLTREIGRVQEQNKLEYARTEQILGTVGRSDRASGLTWFGRLTTTTRVAIASAVIAGLSLGSWYYYARISRPRDLLQQLYSPGAPAARAQYFLELVERYGQHDFQELSLRNASLERARLDSVRLRVADLQGSSFALSTLKDVDFGRANLGGVDFKGADLTGASFAGADLRGAQFDKAILENADLTLARLDGASFVGAHVSWNQITKGETISDVIGPDRSVWNGKAIRPAGSEK